MVILMVISIYTKNTRMLMNLPKITFSRKSLLIETMPAYPTGKGLPYPQRHNGAQLGNSCNKCYDGPLSMIIEIYNNNKSTIC